MSELEDYEKKPVKRGRIHGIKKKVLLSGSKGMLGSVIGPYLSSKGYEVKGFDLDEGDICDTAWLEKVFMEWQPAIFCNCAGYTKVDEAETHQSIAFRVNADALSGIMDLCANAGTVLVHFSTDYVFDGSKKMPYIETDPPNPISVYGQSKWAGEKNIFSHKERYDRFYLIRTSWLYGHHGPNFIATILELARKRKELNVVADQTGTPTSCQDLAKAVYALLQTERFGIYHFSGEGSCTWFEFALSIMDIAQKMDMELKVEHVRPVTTKEFNRPAPRPAFSVLDKSKYKTHTGEKVRHWLDSLEKFIISMP